MVKAPASLGLALMLVSGFWLHPSVNADSGSCCDDAGDWVAASHVGEPGLSSQLPTSVSAQIWLLWATGEWTSRWKQLLPFPLLFLLPLQVRKKRFPMWLACYSHTLFPYAQVSIPCSVTDAHTQHNECSDSPMLWASPHLVTHSSRSSRTSACRLLKHLPLWLHYCPHS